MKAAVLYQPGGPERLILEERSIPRPSPSQVLVRVKAFGLNRSELMTRKGFSPTVKLPRILGIECVGEVVEDPAGLFQPGQKVAACMGGMGRDYEGSYAEYTVLPASILYAFESALPWSVLGAIPELFQTAYGSLHLALTIQAGQRLLIRGGTSSVGLLAIQLAKKAGLYVVATTRTSSKESLLVAAGADAVLIDSGSLAAQVRKNVDQGFDYVLELVGTTTLVDSLHCVRPGGTVCMTGMLSEQWSFADFAPMDWIPATVRLTIYDSGQIRVDQASFHTFLTQIEQGLIQLKPSRVFTLEEINQAHELMDSNNAGGKIVVIP